MSTTQHAGTETTDFEEDPRYRVARRELIVALLYWLAFTVTISGVAWILGGGEKVQELDFIMGFPEWFFWSVPVTCFAFSAIAYVLVRTLFTDIPLDADGDGLSGGAPVDHERG